MKKAVLKSLNLNTNIKKAKEMFPLIIGVFLILIILKSDELNFEQQIASIIAAITVSILFQQWRTNHYRYKLDLYDKRFSVYQALRKFLGTILQKGIKNVFSDDYLNLI